MQDPTHLPRVPGGRPAGHDRCVRPRPGPALRRGAVASCLLIALLGAGPPAWGASRGSAEASPEYVFHLRYGSQVQTSHYWEEGREYRLERFGGVIGLNKADVARIERIEPGSARAPVPAGSAFPATPEARPEPSQGIAAAITAYVAEMVEWVRAWVARLWTPRRGDRPPLALIIGVVVAVPILVFGGKRLGGWLFSDLHP